MTDRSKQKKEERTWRIRAMNRKLTQLYPNARIALNFSNNLELLIAVVLSAQCTDKKVNEVTAKLFKKYRTIDDYLVVDPRVFEEDIRQTGFYKAKTKNILGAVRVLKARFDGVIPKTMSEILTLPGVARKTGNVVLGNAYGIAEGIAVDTHIRRFAIRFDLSDYKDPVRIERDLMDILPRKEWNRFTYRLINYGRERCPARPHPCEEHPLTKLYPRAAQIWPKAR